MKNIKSSTSYLKLFFRIKWDFNCHCILYFMYYNINLVSFVFNLKCHKMSLNNVTLFLSIFILNPNLYNPFNDFLHYEDVHLN